MRLWIFLALAPLALSGCKKATTYTAVSGTVRVGTTPLAHGLIRFSPEPGAGFMASAGITDGKYSVQVTPGKYKVTVEATQAPPTTAGEKVPAKELPTIPAKYKTGVPTEITGPNPALYFDLSK